VAKEKDSSYLEGRISSAWRATRASRRNEFVIGGFTYGGASRINRLRSREPFASLLFGAYDRWQQLRFVGEIAGGFDQPTQAALAGVMDGLTASECPFAEEPPMHRLVFWCQPALVAAVAYSKWTDDGRLQFPKFEWLRPDVPSRSCHLPGS
jgi:bifunctional non-homologous end joining protein LigD